MSGGLDGKSNLTEVRPAPTLIRQMATNLHYLEHDPATHKTIEGCTQGWCPYAVAWLEAEKAKV